MPLIPQSAKDDGFDTSIFELIPSGTEVIAKVTKSELKITSSGTGERISIQSTITQGEFQGRVIFNGFNIINDNPLAARIGRAEWGLLCKAVGLDPNSVANTDEVHGIEFKAVVQVSKGTGGYDDSNELKKFEEIVPDESDFG